MAALETRFIVETLIGNDWQNVWMIDGEAASFATDKEAQAELDEHLADMAEAVAAGNLSDAMDRECFRIVQIERPNPYAVRTEKRNAEWRRILDAVTGGTGVELAGSDDLTEPGLIFNAICYALRYSHHEDRKGRGYITTAHARVILAAVESVEPTDPASNLSGLLEPHPCKPEGQSEHWPINRKRDMAAEDEAWAFIHGIERGWFTYDRAGFLQWSEAGRDRYAAGAGATFVQSSAGQAAFAF